MRTLVHLSDLHFGSADPRLVAAVLDTVTQLAPDIVAVSGDFTQRARRAQFRQARDFLRRLPQPQLVVPGNHDVPLYNVLARFGFPLWAYRHYISRDLRPVYRGDGLLVVGVDTTRSFTIKDGGLRADDVDRLAVLLGEADETTLKVVVCHHPFDPPASRSARFTRPRPDAGAITRLVEHGADLVLTGHLHVAYTGGSATRYRVPGRAAIVIEAGTATSTRVRGEPNSFNVIRAEGDVITVQRLAWSEAASAFAQQHLQVFRRAAAVGWAEDAHG